jgi:hypothetical protein
VEQFERMPILLRSKLAEEFARNRVEFQRNRELFAQLEAESRNREQLSRGAMRRHEIAMNGVIATLNDLHDASRAHTEAIFRLLDQHGSE